MPTNNIQTNVYREPVGLPLVSYLPICQPRNNFSIGDLIKEMGVDIIEVDEKSCSDRTILSTHDSLKRKSTCPQNTCHNVSNNATPSKKQCYKR